MLVADIAAHYPALLLSGVLASSFYGSILTYAVSSHKLPHSTNAAIVKGLVLGPVCALGGLTCMGAMLSTTTSVSVEDVVDVVGSWSVGLHSGFGICHFWMVLIWGSWIVRDRHRPGVYGTLGHAYLEAVADGVMVISCPMTAVIGAVVGMVVQSAVRFTYWMVTW